MDELDKKIAFLKEMEKFKDVKRTTHKLSGELESDAEHSWNLTFILILFKDEFKEYNYSKMLELATLHDLVELYAGDTFAYDEKAVKTKKEREEKSLKKILEITPSSFKEKLKENIKEYEEGKTKEAIIVKALDKIVPIIMNLNNGGRSWQEHKISKEKVFNYKREIVEKNPVTKELFHRLIKEGEDRNLFWKD